MPVAVASERELLRGLDVAPPEVAVDERQSPLATPGALKQHHELLGVILRKTRDASRGQRYAQAALWGVAASGACVLSALLVAALAPGLIGAGLGVGLTVSLAVTGASWLGATLLIWRAQPSLEQIARALQEEQPWLRNDVVAALAFGQQLIEGRFDEAQSRVLAEAHVRQTAADLHRRCERGHVAHLLPRPELAAATSALTGCALLLLAPLLAAPDWTSRALTGSIKQASEQRSPKDIERMLVGSLSVSYVYPAYTRQPAHSELFSTGHIEAIVGAEVTLQTYALVNGLSQLELVITSESGQEQVRPVELGQGGRLSVSFTIQHSGTYRFRARTPQGATVREPASRAIIARPDRSPRVEVRSHKGQIEVSPQDVLELQLVAEDDWGVTSLARQWQLQAQGQTPQRQELRLPELQTSPPSFQGVVTLDLASLNLQPKDVVTLTFEVTDNNTLTGPGVGLSEPITLIVSSAEDKHLKNLEEQQAVAEALLETLSDVLEAAPGERVARADDSYGQRALELEPAAQRERLESFARAQASLGVTLTLMARVAERLREDPLMVPRDLALFEALYQQLNALYQRGEGTVGRALEIARSSRLTTQGVQRVADYAAELESALEKGVLRLQDLLASQKMQSVQASAQEIRELKDRLKTLLERYRDAQDPELKQDIMREIGRLRQRMNELMQRMQSQLERLPQEHVNAEAIEQARMESDAKKLVEGFEDIEQRLERGDIDGALEALDKMTEGLDSLSKQMDEGFEQPQGLSEFDQEVNALMDEVNDLASAQQKVEQETQRVQRSIREEQRAALDKQLEQATQQLKQKVAQQRRELDALDLRGMPQPNLAAADRLRRQLKDLESSLDQRDIEEGLRQARAFADELENLRFSMQLSQRYVKRPSVAHDRLKDAMRQTRAVSQRGDEILGELEQMMEEARQHEAQAQQDPRIKGLEQDQRGLDERAQQLRQRVKDSSGKFPALEQQLGPGMERAQKAMQQAQDGLGGRRLQRALDAEREALKELEQVKQNMKQALQNQRQPREQGQRDQERAKVEIPSQPSPTHKAYREAIQKGMKEDRLEDYASDIESYYKSLTE